MEKLSLKELKNKRFHFIGIGGISMSALAQMLYVDNFYVQGSDIAENDETEILNEKGITVFSKHKADNLKNIDVVVYSSAIHDDNEELKFAKENNLIVIKRAELLGMVASLYKVVIAVAGSHGKTTTTAMLAEIFMKAGLDPTFHIGGSLNSISSNYRLGSKQFFITEACEYQDNFLLVNPDIAVSLNIDSDHLDYFKSLDGVVNSFQKFVSKVKDGGVSIVCEDDENSKSLLSGDNVSTFGFDDLSDMSADNIRQYKNGYYSFVPVFMGYKFDEIKLNIMGKHNILNALASILVSIACNISFENIKFALENFSGTKRRCQELGKVNGATVYHDYAHHPKQIEKMLEVAKELLEEGGRIITVFEPHTYSRTKFLLNDFAQSFKGSDISIFCPAYSARENLNEGYEADTLAEETRQHVKDVRFIKTFDDILSVLKSEVKQKDIVLILGAGTIEHLAKMIENKDL